MEPLSAFIILIGFIACVQSIQQTDLDYLGSNLDVKITIDDNLQSNGQKHKFSLVLKNTGNKAITPEQWSIYFYSFFMIESDHLPSINGYTLDNYNVKFDHIKGCLFSMTPTADFIEIQPNMSRYIEFYGQNWAVTKSDVQPNWYVDSNDLKPVLIQSTATGKEFVTDMTSPKQWKRYRNDQYNPFTPQSRFRRYQIRNFNSPKKLVVPTPKEMTIKSNQMLDVSTMTVESTAEVKNESIFLANELGVTFTENSDTASKLQPNRIRLWKNVDLNSNNNGYYHLYTNTTDNTVNIIGRSIPAVYYGIQSLLSLVAGSSNKIIPDVSIEDEPRFEFRGIHVDVSRNFKSKYDLMRLMDVMAMYKLNKLHLHLSDDEGWRIEIPALPELTEVSSKRCHDLSENTCLIPQLGSGPDNSTSGSGYYTVDDYKELVAEATKRHIEVIPEIDMPGHSRAAIIAMEARYRKFQNSNVTEAMKYRLIDPNDTSNYMSVQMFKDNAVNPCIESTYSFLETVISEIKKMHIGLKTFHFGGDEVAKGAWINSSHCQEIAAKDSYYKEPRHFKDLFARRVGNITNQLGLQLAGWEDGLMGDSGIPYNRSTLPNAEVYGNAWQNIWEWGVGRRPYDLANNGYKVIMSQATHLFFDHPYEPDPSERGLYWATRFTDTMKSFMFLPDSLYDNIDVRRSGEHLTKAAICGEDNKKCPPLLHPENIIGMQAQSWSETVYTSENFDYMLFPRVFALAERSWHKAVWEGLGESERKAAAMEDWEAFANTIGHKELQRLSQMNVSYRIAPPGAIIQNGILKVNTEYPGFTVEYSRDNGTTWKNVPHDWSVTDNIPFHLRSRSPDGRRTSRSVIFYPEEPLPYVSQHEVNYIAENVEITYEVISNLVNDWHNFTAKITIRNTGSKNITAGNWAIYMYSIRLLQPNDFPYPKGYLLSDCNLRAFHIGGSLFKLTPEGTNFLLRNGMSSSCEIVAKYWQSARTDSMPNWYVGADGMDAKLINNTAGEDLKFVTALTKPAQYRRYPEDKYLPYTAQSRFQLNNDTADHGKAEKLIIPTPVEIITHGSGRVLIDDTWVVLKSAVFEQEVSLLADTLKLDPVDSKPQSKYIELVNVTLLEVLPNKTETAHEAYRLEVSTSGNSVIISAVSKPGAFYGIQSLFSLMNGQLALPEVTINDQPRFQYRGMHVDVGRNFHGKEDIKQILQTMGMYKLNKFHFHLTDDEGWRIEIPGLPELTQIGSHRCHDPSENECILPQLGSGPSKSSSGSGYYNVSDYKDILRFANDRHIEVIPEIDMPGHCRAGIKAMEERYRKYKNDGNDTAAMEFLLSEFDDPTKYLSVQFFTDNAINPCINSTINFITYVIRALKEMHKDTQPLSMYHFGGDEVAGAWKDSPKCRALLSDLGYTSIADMKKYFAHLLSRLTDGEGLNMAAWGDGLMSHTHGPFNLTEYKSQRPITSYNWENVWEWGQGDKAYKLANAGYKVVLGHATHLYFDHPYEPDPEERGFYWATRYTDTRKTFGFDPDNIYANAGKAGNGNPLTHDQICTNNGTCLQLHKPENIIGIQGHLWSETVRTRDQLEYMIYPRLLALAERAWHKSAWESLTDKQTRETERDKDWVLFANTLGHKELQRLDKMGVKYRVSVPGAKVVDSILLTNIDLPGLIVQYSTDNQRTWKVATQNTEIDGGKTVYLRTRSSDGNRFSRTTHLQTQQQYTASAHAHHSSFIMLFLILTLQAFMYIPV